MLFGDCDGVTYRIYNIHELLTNLNNESFREKLTDDHNGEMRSLDVKINLGLELDPNRMSWNEKKWALYFNQNNLSQDSIVFDTQRLYPFSELMYESVMLEGSTRQHERGSTYGSNLVSLKNLEVSKATKDAL